MWNRIKDWFGFGDKFVVDTHTFTPSVGPFADMVWRTDFTVKFMEDESGQRWLSISGSSFKGPYGFKCLGRIRDKWIEGREIPDERGSDPSRKKHHIMIG